MVDHVLGGIEPGSIVDLYAGVGLFSLTAAAAGKGSVIAVEGDPNSAADLTRNAGRHGGPVEARTMPVEEFVRRGHARPSTIIVDPPRRGMSREALDGAVALRAPTLIYVSCDVATLARDAKLLVDAGYRIDHARAFDMFPNTAHIETVLSFRR
jgi:23S rRNA (uracil1939-C5)-methyltransferase